MRGALFFILFFSGLSSFYVKAQDWASECVGYYQLELPGKLEVALHPVDLIINPRTDPYWRKDKYIPRHIFPKISFGNDRYQNNQDSVQAQFSAFQYGSYFMNISSENDISIDFPNYEKEFRARKDDYIKTYWDERNYRMSIKLPVRTKESAEQYLEYKIDHYPDAFLTSNSYGYSLTINKNKQLYIFNRKNKKNTLARQIEESKDEVNSLINSFQTRQLYEMPKGQGFCIPYGFISGDSGHEPRNMGVTYRLKDHPDVTIFFQDLGVNDELDTDKGSMKEAVTRMWNSRYLMGARKKELQSPKWQRIEMDGREGMGTFVKGTYSNVPVYDSKGHVSERLNYINYGYLAYVRGNKENRNKEPDLILYVYQDHEQANGKPQMNKDELKKLAERIVASVKRR